MDFILGRQLNYLWPMDCQRVHRPHGRGNWGVFPMQIWLSTHHIFHHRYLLRIQVFSFKITFLYFFFFSVCDSRNLNLSPFCNLTSYSQMAKWQPAINSTYGSAMTDYTRKLQGPLRLKYPGQGKAGADRELLTSLKQVLNPNSSQIDQDAEFNMIDFK